MSTMASLADFKASTRTQYLWSRAEAALTAGLRTGWNEGSIPAAGSLSVGNTANGLVPDDTTTGAMLLNQFVSPGYLTWAEMTSANNLKLWLYDRLFHAGSYTFNANVTLASQPSYAARVPDSNYSGLRILCEISTALTGALTATIGYTNQDGIAASTSVTTAAAAGAGTAAWVPLAAGDTGVQQINSVVGTVASGGSFNIVVCRMLAFVGNFKFGRTVTGRTGWTRGMETLGMPIIYPTSCLATLRISPGAGGYAYDLTVEVAG